MKIFTIGSRVIWTSQANARQKTKEGVVVEVVPEGRLPPKHHGFEKSTTLPRNHESYLVEVDGRTSTAKKKLYWPRVAGLSLVRGPEDEVDENGGDGGRDTVRSLQAELAKVTGELDFYKGRERTFAEMLKVADEGAFRADWEAPLRKLVSAGAAIETIRTALQDVKAAMVGGDPQQAWEKFMGFLGAIEIAVDSVK